LTESEKNELLELEKLKNEYEASKFLTGLKFSPKYDPLFDLLLCREIINDPYFKHKYSKKEQKYWNDLHNVDTVLMSGGRDSGKTFALSTFNVKAAKHHNHRILYTRQTMTSTDNSITEALEKRMEELYSDGDFNVSGKTYTSNEGKGKITITGQQTSKGTQTAKLKSLEDYSIFETDEGEELESYESWKKIKRSIRAKDVQALNIIVFNPPTREHWLHDTFYEDIPDGFNGIKDKILYIHTNYLDNGQDNMAEHNWIEYEGLKKAYEEYMSTPKEQRELLPNKLVKKYKEYKFDILGGFREVADGVIYEDWEYGEFNNSLPFCRGLDFGFDDPDALVKVAVDHKQKKIYVDEELFQNGLGTNQLGQVLLNRVGQNGLIIADAAHKRLINDLYHLGLNIKRCKKGGGSVLRNINTVQGYTLIVTKRSKNVVKALRNYVWHDKRSGVPKNDFKHFPDAIGYAAMDLISY
jgi:phage terminase large subunit